MRGNFRIWLGVAALELVNACGSQQPPSAAVDAGSAGSTSAPAAGGGAQAPDAALPSVTLNAKVTLSALAPGADKPAGSATLHSTSEGVDLELTLGGCAGGRAYSVEILDARECTQAAVRDALWKDGRGAGIPPAYCSGGGQLALAYARIAARGGGWSIAGKPESDVVGRVLVLRLEGEPEPATCGVVERAEDVARALPPTAADSPPSVEARAALSGLCLARMFPNTGPGCPDPAGLLQCAQTHCNVDRCLSVCADYARCLEASGDVCTLSTCDLSPECSHCQNDSLSCVLGFCGEHVTCAPAFTPDGPCQRVSFCCALQGQTNNACSGLLAPLATSLGGDSNCIGSMNDWDVLSHMRVPCTYGPAQAAEASPAVMPEPLPASPEPRLADGMAGKLCASDAECTGGVCGGADQVTEVRYCTRACMASSECGSGGLCSALSEHAGEKRCLAKCEATSECREGFFCAGALQGSKLNLPGSCRPLRKIGQLADAVAGRACSSDSECSGGRCATTNLLGTAYPGNYCTGRCYQDAQCGQAGVCVWPKGSVDPGYCLQECTTNSDCPREGYACWQMGDGERVLHACYPAAKALPDHTTGIACKQVADCKAPQAMCAQELPFAGLVGNELAPAASGYCTQRCALDAECGAGAQCINYGTQGGICLASCSNAAPCRQGYMCLVHGRDADPAAAVCVPAQSLP